MYKLQHRHMTVSGKRVWRDMKFHNRFPSFYAAITFAAGLDEDGIFDAYNWRVVPV